MSRRSGYRFSVKDMRHQRSAPWPRCKPQDRCAPGMARLRAGRRQGLPDHMQSRGIPLKPPGSAMIDLHYWTTPNGHKITIFLEEAGLPYKIFPVNIGKGEQFKREFLAIS